MNPDANLTDEEILQKLSGESVRGPRTFRGRSLAPYTSGLRDVIAKVVSADDTSRFHDVALMYVLGEAYAPEESARLEKRVRLMIATDHVPAFRATVSCFMDDLSPEELEQARQVADDLLGLVKLAEVSLTEKKTDSEPPSSTPAPSPMTTPAPSSPSRKRRGGKTPTSAGS